MNAICITQNSEQQLERLAAQRSLYSSVKRIFAVHAALSTLVASVLAFGAMVWPGLKPFAALWGVGLAVLDQLWLTPWQKKLRQEAATIQETFDCDVLGLPWNGLKAEKPVDSELVVKRAAIYRRIEPTFASLRDWYPAEVCRMPLFLARLICQRTNARWDAEQRRKYALFLAGVVVALLIALVAFAIQQELQVGDLLTAVVPLAPAALLALRQYKENSEAATRLDNLKSHALKLWKRALQGGDEADLAHQSRLLQDELFDHRKRTIPVFDWVYNRMKDDHESQMRCTAAQLVHELENAAAGSGVNISLAERVARAPQAKEET